jgi:hypothetical protein
MGALATITNVKGSLLETFPGAWTANGGTYTASP